MGGRFERSTSFPFTKGTMFRSVPTFCKSTSIFYHLSKHLNVQRAKWPAPAPFLHSLPIYKPISFRLRSLSFAIRLSMQSLHIPAILYDSSRSLGILGHRLCSSHSSCFCRGRKSDLCRCRCVDRDSRTILSVCTFELLIVSEFAGSWSGRKGNFVL